MSPNFISTASFPRNNSFRFNSEKVAFICKRVLFIVIVICFSLLVNAQVSKSVNVTAGSLYSVLTATELQTVTDLTLTGTLDARDFKIMRDNMPVLTFLDLNAATIDEYTGADGTFYGGNFHFPADEIPYSAFYDSNSVGKITLKSVVLPESITAIGPYAFRGCAELTSFSIPGVIISIGDYAFGSCRKLTSFIIPEGTASIGIYVFEDCSGLTSITIPSTVSSIGEGAFMSFTGLINVAEGNHSYSSLDGVLFNKTQTALLQCPISKKHNFQIPESVTFIGNYAFYGCKSLTSIAVPSMVTTIGKEAFGACSGITSLTIPAPVNYIGPQAFWGCRSLINITTANPVPLAFGSSFDVFGEINKSGCYLNVPYGTSSLFRNSGQWQDFTNIIEMPGVNPSSTNVNLQSAEGSSANIDISSGGSWSASSDQLWLTVNPSSGIGNGTLTITAQANLSNTNRMATVTVSSGSSESQKITISQDGAAEIPTVQKPLAHISKTNLVPILDGFIDEIWSNATENNIAVPFRSETPTLGGLGETSWKALWNDDGIYVLVKVADDVFSPAFSGTDRFSNWMYDRVEIYADCNSLKNDGLGAGYGKGHYYFFENPVVDNLNGELIVPSNDSQSSYAYQVNGSSYMSEIFIPFSKLTDQNGAMVDKSQPIGFDITVVDNDLTTPNRNRMNWANAGKLDECWNNMDDAGLIQLDSGNPIVQIPVSKITLTSGSITTDNGTLQMNALILPENATNKNLNWTVINNTGIASVNETGLVTAISNGTVTIIASAMDSGKLEGSASVEISGQKIDDPNSNQPDMYVTLGAGKGTAQCFIGSTPNSPVASDQTWLRVEPTTGSGEQQVRMEFDANSTYMPRMATVIVSQDGKMFQKIIITQEGKVEIPVNTGNSNIGQKWDSEIWDNKNLIKNWNFNNSLSEWNYWADSGVNGQTDPVVLDGTVSMSTKLAAEKWHYLLFQQGMQAKANVPYTLKFKSWSDLPRTNSVVFEDTWENNYIRFGASSDPGSVNGRAEWNYYTTPESKWFTFHVVFDQMQPNTLQKIQWMLSTADAPIYLDSVILVEDDDIYSRGSINLSLSSASLIMPEIESSAKVSITSNSNWTVNCDQSWISLNLLSGSGNDELSITAIANPEIISRNATIIILAEGGISKRIIVSQNGKNQEPIDPGNSGNSFLPITYIYTSAELSNVPVELTPDSKWNAIADQAWLNVSPLAGTGSQTINLMTEENLSYIPRTGTIIVFENGIASQLFIVTQDGSELFQNNELSSKKISITGKESKALISIAHESTLAVSDQNWLEVNPFNGSIDKTLSFNIEPNPTNVSRTAIVTVYSNGVATQTIKITQEAGTSTVGISPVVNNPELLLYPNPTSGKIKLIFNEMPRTGIQVTVFDFTGRTIIQQHIQDNEEWIDLEGHSPGIYFFKTNIENLKVQKVILK